MTSRRARVLAAIGAAALVLEACGPAKPAGGGGGVIATPAPSRMARDEAELSILRQAALDNPADDSAQKKLQRAEKEAVEDWTARGNAANTKGSLGEAGAWWRKALEITPDEARRMSPAGQAVQKNMTALEYFANVAYLEERFEESISTWGAVRLAVPARLDVAEKHDVAQRALANELHAKANVLAQQGLPGAALVVNLRALKFDPQHAAAYATSNDLRKSLRAKTRVLFDDVHVDDKAVKDKTFDAPLLATLSSHVDDYPPYTKGKDPAAARASFVIFIEEFTRGDQVKEGTDELPNTEPPSKILVPNPAIPVARKKLETLGVTLATRQAELKKAIAARKGKAVKPDDPGLALARQVDETKAEIAATKRELAALPARVPPPPPPATWKMPWKETTRTVSARVRIEVSEPEFPEPVSVTITESMAKTDRAHDAFSKKGMKADSLDLPPFDEMLRELAGKFQPGAAVVMNARQRRLDKLLTNGRAALAGKRESDALESFVAALFLMGPNALPSDASAFVARSLEHGRFKEITGLQ